ncbi:antifreeze protein Maxi-like [Anabrus simplex]|uniref:antifreeze protein Maxi-like n=1 Tax=Anabrus simplex TaxID=316456 RepID=UPI0035A30ABD
MATINREQISFSVISQLSVQRGTKWTTSPVYLLRNFLSSPSKMNTKIFVLLACLGLAVCRPQDKTSDLDTAETRVPVHYSAEEADVGAESRTYGSYGGHGGHGVGHSVGSGLVSIAQGAVDSAHRAIASQAVAGGQAAFQAKESLAQNAAAAAATAQAALAGKQVIVSQLEQQTRNAAAQVDSEYQQLNQAQRAAQAAQQSAQQAQTQVRSLTAALNVAQTNADHAARAAQEASSELASQTSMLASAKQRLALIEEQLGDARADLEATQAAALKAAAAAQTAQANANKYAHGVHGGFDGGDGGFTGGFQGGFNHHHHF